MSTPPSASAACLGKEQNASLEAKDTRTAEFEAPLRPKQRERMDKNAKE